MAAPVEAAMTPTVRRPAGGFSPPPLPATMVQLGGESCRKRQVRVPPKYQDFEMEAGPSRRTVQHSPPPPAQVPPPTCLKDVLLCLPETSHWAIRHSAVPDNGITIAEAIKAHQAVTVTDASLKDCFGTAALVIEGRDSTNRAIGVNIVPGPIKDGDSYQCELAGLIGAVILVNPICTLHNIQQGSI